MDSLLYGFCLPFFSEMLAVPHFHQAIILKYPQNENFIYLLLFMRIYFIFRFGNNKFLNLIAMPYVPFF